MAVEIVDCVAPGDTFSNSNVTDSSKKSESERRHRRRKQKKNKKGSEVNVEEGTDFKENAEVSEEVVVEYIPEQPEFEKEGFLDEFRKIFAKFSYLEESIAKDKSEEKAELNSDSDSDSEKEEKEKYMSKKKKKLEKRLKIGELKQLSGKADVVEVWDADSTDPKLLVYLKSYRNTIPVPIHWSQKRKYLQGKRGMEKKQPYQLPDYIAATGIAKLREAYIEKEDGKKLKQKQRDRMQPKMATMEIDYQVKNLRLKRR